MKTTKLIATLGVAAALGVSCIPMVGIHAAEDPSASATITLSVASQVTVDWGDMGATGDKAITHSMDPNQFSVASEHHTISITKSNNGRYGFDLTVRADGNNGGSLKSSLYNESAGTTIPATTTGTLTAGTDGWGLQPSTTPLGGSSNDGWLAPAEPTATSATLVKEKLGKTEGADGVQSVDIYYGFATGTDTKSGDYVAKINYTLTARTD